jgi:cohesin complex subunit SCC1
MFYSEIILTRRGPLAKVWLAAHYERKLSKTQTLQTDISQSVDAIMGQDTAPMALRLSGQLLLGVVRIYSRKTKYLLDDCNEALLKIKMAFRPGIVDMTEEQLSVPQNAITLQGEGIDLDLLLPNINWDIDFERPVAPGQQHVARKADITLASAEDFQFDIQEPSLDVGPSDGIGSQDFEVDLGISFDAEAADRDEVESVEIGRREAGQVGSTRPSMEPIIPADGDDFDFERQPSEGMGGDDIFPVAGGVDEDFELDISFDPDAEVIPDREKTPEQIHDSRASSPLTPPPPATPLPEVEEPLTPKPKKRQMVKKQIIDEVTELETGVSGRFGRQPQADLSGILGEQHFLPRSRTMMRLLEIRADPVSHFMPTRTTNEGTFFCAAPPGLAPELEELFLFPTTTRRPRGESTQPREPPPKRARTASEEPDVEIARRAASEARSAVMSERDRPSMGPLEGDMGGFEGLGEEAGFMDVDLPAPQFEVDDGMGMGMETTPGPRASVLPSSRLSTPVGAEAEEATRGVDDGVSAIAIFDSRSSEVSSTQAPSQDEFAELESTQGDQQHRGFSKYYQSYQHFTEGT